MSRTRGFPHLRRTGPALLVALFLLCFCLNHYYNGFKLWYSISVLVERFAPPGSFEQRPGVAEPGEGGYAWNWPYLHELDGLFWTDNAVRMVREGTPRIRDTRRDNAPYGRAMHWSALPAWGLAGLGALAAPFTGGDWIQGIKLMAPWAPPILAFCGFLGLGTILSRFAGWTAAALFLVATQFFPMLQDAFLLGTPDHHGLQLLAFGGLLLGLLWALWPGAAPSSSTPPIKRQAYYGLTLSAVSGAVGLWLGATQMALLLALIATGLGCALLAVALSDPDDRDMRWSPVYWLFWGSAGAALTLLFYLLEYAPHPPVLRLEVNHPLHAGAWFGGGMALYGLHRLLLVPGKKGISGFLLLFGLVAALCPALAVVLVRETQSHALQDPVMFRFHGLLGEFQPFLRADVSIIRGVQMLLLAVPVLISFGLLLFPERFPVQSRVVLIVAMIPVPILLGLCFVQKRWSHAAATAAILLAIVIYSLLCRHGRVAGAPERSGKANPPAPRWKSWTRPLANPILPWLIICGGMWGAWMNLMRAQDFERYAAAIYVGPQMNMLHLAHAIHATTPPGRRPVVVHYPNTATGCGQLPFANVPVVGSQYWENLAGVRDQFALLGEPDPAVPRAIAGRRGITHVLTDTRGGSLDGVLEVWLDPAEPRLETLAPRTLVWKLGTPNPCPPPWLELVVEMQVPGYAFKQRLYRVVPEKL